MITSEEARRIIAAAEQKLFSCHEIILLRIVG